MKYTIRSVFLCAILICSWGCEQKSAKLQKSVVPPDKTLYETGSNFLKNGQYIKGSPGIPELDDDVSGQRNGA